MRYRKIRRRTRKEKVVRKSKRLRFSEKETRKCRICALVKDLEEFVDKYGSYGTTCLDCSIAVNAANKRYPERYAFFNEKQHGKYGICGQEPPAGKKLFLDHDHSNWIERGLLCNRCNSLLRHGVDSI